MVNSAHSLFGENATVVVQIDPLPACRSIWLVSCNLIRDVSTNDQGRSVVLKGDMYFIKEISGRFMYDLNVDKNMQRDRFLVLGRKIEADVIPDVRVVALRPAK